MPLSSRLALVSPLVLLAVMFLGAIAISIVGLAVVRKLVPEDALREHNEVAGFVFGVVGAAYGVLLGFAVLQVWEQWSDAESRVAAEEGIADSIYRNIRNYPNAAAAAPLLAEYERYVRSVLTEEYPAMAQGGAAAVTDASFQRVWERAGQLDPSTPAEQACFQNIFALLGELAKEREMRLQAADGRVPEPLWYALLIGGFATISFSWLFAGRRFWFQAAINGALAMALLLPLYVIILLNHPFAGSVRIRPGGYRELLDNVISAQAAVERQAEEKSGAAEVRLLRTEASR